MATESTGRKDIAFFFYPALTSVIGFFLLQFYLTVKNVDKTVTTMQIDFAANGVRIESVEKRIDRLERELNDLKMFVYEREKKQ